MGDVHKECADTAEQVRQWTDRLRRSWLRFLESFPFVFVLASLADVAPQTYGTRGPVGRRLREITDAEEQRRSLLLSVVRQGPLVWRRFWSAVEDEKAVEARCWRQLPSPLQELRKGLAWALVGRKEPSLHDLLGLEHEQVYQDLNLERLSYQQLKTMIPALPDRKLDDLVRPSVGQRGTRSTHNKFTGGREMITLTELVTRQAEKASGSFQASATPSPKQGRRAAAAMVRSSVGRIRRPARVILGECGYGKTMITRKITHTWADLVLGKLNADGSFSIDLDDLEEDLARALSKYEFVFELSASLIEKRARTTQAADLFYLLGVNNAVPQSRLSDTQEYLICHADRVLVILDGADEMSQQSEHMSVFVENLLYGYALAGCTLLATSRVSAAVRPFVECGDICAVIREMTDEQVDLAVDRRISAIFESFLPTPWNVEQICANLKRKLRMHNRTVFPIVRTPLTASLFIDMYAKRIQEGIHDIELAQSSQLCLTALHQSVVNHVQRRQNVRFARQSYRSGKSVKTAVIHEIEQVLENIAWVGTLKRQYKFTAEELQEELPLVEQAASMGLLISYSDFSSDGDIFQFYHVSLQEYFAAKAVVHSKDPLLRVHECLQQFCYGREREMFWLFVAALIPVHQLSLLLDALMNASDPKIGKSKDTYNSLLSLTLGCVTEAALFRDTEMEKRVVAEAAGRLLASQGYDLNLDNWQMEPKDVFSILGALNIGNKTIHLVRLKNCQLGREHGQAFVSMPLIENHLIKELNISCNHGATGDGLAYVVEVLKSSKTLLCLKINNCQLNPEDGKHLGGLLEENIGLKTLKVRKNILAEKGTARLLRGLQQNERSNLNELDLSSNFLSITGAYHIAKFLASPGCHLRVLHLMHNGLMSLGVCIILDIGLAKPKQSSLVHLDLSYNEASQASVATSLDLLTVRCQTVDAAEAVSTTAPTHLNAEPLYLYIKELENNVFYRSEYSELGGEETGGCAYGTRRRLNIILKVPNQRRLG